MRGIYYFFLLLLLLLFIHINTIIRKIPYTSLITFTQIRTLLIRMEKIRFPALTYHLLSCQQ